MFPKRFASVLCAALFAASPAWAHPPVIGIISEYTTGAAERNYEEQKRSAFGTRVLAKEGFGFGLGDYLHFLYSAGNPNRAYSVLQQFNAVILETPYENINTLTEEKARGAKAAREGVERYVREGGGLLILPQVTRYANAQDREYNNLVFAGIGLELLDEGIYDPQRAFMASLAPGILPAESFFWTENITKGHPVTEGVERLCLPRNRGDVAGTCAVRLSPEWQVLVRGEASARSYGVTKDHALDVQQAGSYSSAPPIVAVRTFGKGRIMIWGIPGRSAYLNYGVPGWNMVVEEAGFAEGHLPSFGKRLMVNALKWLAAPSSDNPDLGTFSMGAYGPIRFPASTQFDNAKFEPPARGIRGIVGARTALSDGQGTVEEYVQAAKAAGLSFIVFTDSLEALSMDKLDQLKAECKRCSSDEFYACPGVEFTDDIGNRWALWCERVVYPPSQFIRPYQKPDSLVPPVLLWDGKVIQNVGHYFKLNNFSANALLTYKNLRERGARPERMWFFYRVAPFVYDRGHLVADNFAEELFALRDARKVDPVSYTRIYSPAEVASAAAQCVTLAKDLPSARKWLNTSCSTWGAPTWPSVSGGPLITQWSGLNQQYEQPLDVRGIQRVRCRFEATSPAGIREAVVHDANYGIVRRFLGDGRTTLAREFEMVHDRDRYLVLEVTDGEGRKAISCPAYLFCYKSSLFRCGDNWNFLGGAGLVWHPYEYMAIAQPYLGVGKELIQGYDSSYGGLSRMARLVPDWNRRMVISTRELGTYPNVKGEVLLNILHIVMPGNDVKVCDMTTDYLVEGIDTPKHPTPSSSSIPFKVEDNRLFKWEHRAVYTQNRNNMFITWNHRRAREGAENYRGGLVLHEGKITFKCDATLSGTIPVPLVTLTSMAANDDTSALCALVKDSKTGAMILPASTSKEYMYGILAPGGYAAMVPGDDIGVFYSAGEVPIRYSARMDKAAGRVTAITLGIGQPGLKVTAGTVLTYRYAMATLGGERKTPEEYLKLVEDVGDSFGLGGGDRGVKADATVGAVVGKEMFLALAADKGEAQVTVSPRPTIVDLPVCVQGVEDNGCAAVYSTARPWFRWIGVAEGKGYFQENVDAGSNIWAGNVFLSDNKSLKLTLAADGIAEGREPFLEVHNPTDAPIEATVSSPAHTPKFGGTNLKVSIPAGSSIVVPLKARS